MFCSCERKERTHLSVSDFVQCVVIFVSRPETAVLQLSNWTKIYKNVFSPDSCEVYEHYWYTHVVMKIKCIMVKLMLLFHVRVYPGVCQAVIWCRGAVVMMQYSVMANNYWLLVEGIYLHSLLVITVFSEKKYFYIYLAIGWGKISNCCMSCCDCYHFRNSQSCTSGI